MSSKSEADAGGGKQSPAAGPIVEVDHWQSLSPTLPPISKSTDGDSKRNSATDSDKPYSVFSYREKWLIVCIASYAAIFRRVGTLTMSWVLADLGPQSAHCEYIFPCDSCHLERISQKRGTH